jgi:aldehyde dehydrogenase (NAD+)
VANDVEYGLVASICTNRLDRAKEFASRIEAGMVKVNQTTGFEKQYPFGGWKASSTTTYKEQGREAFDFYPKDKTVYMSHFSL